MTKEDKKLILGALAVLVVALLLMPFIGFVAYSYFEWVGGLLGH